MRSRPRTARSYLPLFRDLLDDQGAQAFPQGLGPMDELLALSLARSEGLRPHEKCKIAAAMGSAESFAAMDIAEAQALLGRVLRPELWNPRGMVELAKRDREYFRGKGILFIALDNPAYPPQLREAYRPPFGLYLRGRLPDPSAPAVAIVGTRIATGQGLSAAYKLAKDLAGQDIWVVSGLAVGIDAAAHRGALSEGGRTLAILPGGMESIYPPSNRGLAAAILEKGGGLATEYPPFSRIFKYRFPERNRIIAGLSRSCVLVQAPEKSGALITAEHALAEGRDVFVHRACIGGARNSGADLLAQQGAAVVGSAADIFAEWSAHAAEER